MLVISLTAKESAEKGPHRVQIDLSWSGFWVSCLLAPEPLLVLFLSASQTLKHSEDRVCFVGEQTERTETSTEAASGQFNASRPVTAGSGRWPVGTAWARGLSSSLDLTVSPWDDFSIHLQFPVIYPKGSKHRHWSCKNEMSRCDRA